MPKDVLQGVWWAWPVLEGGIGVGSALGVSKLGTDQLAAWSVATSVVGMLALWLGWLPLLAALVVVVVRARASEAVPGV